MLTTSAQAALPALNYLLEIANTLEASYRDACENGQRIENRCSALQYENGEKVSKLAELIRKEEELGVKIDVLEDRNAKQYDKINEQDQMYHDLNTRYSRLCEANDTQSTTIQELAKERDALLVNINGYQKDMDGCNRIIDDMRGYIKYVEKWLSNTTTVKEDLETFEEWNITI